MIGSDARFIHSLWLFDRTMHETVQPDLVEAYLAMHLPILSEGGVDLKLGKLSRSKAPRRLIRVRTFFTRTLTYSISEFRLTTPARSQHGTPHRSSICMLA